MVSTVTTTIQTQAIEKETSFILWFDQVGIEDIPYVGGKNASLGEMIQQLAQRGVNVPNGFATTAYAYRYFVQQAGLEVKLRQLFADLDVEDVSNLRERGRQARALVLNTPFPRELEAAIIQAYDQLSERYANSPEFCQQLPQDKQDSCGLYSAEVDVAVRSSATAEDLPEPSFAGQQDTVLNVRGEPALLAACQRCLASLFTDRAIVYRQRLGYDHLAVALSVGVQRLVQAGGGAAGVLFTLDTESGCRDVVVINAAYGFGETVVQGQVSPDELLVFKPTLARGFDPIISRRLGSKQQRLVIDASGELTLEPVPSELQRRFVLSDAEVLQLARWAVLIEEHNGARRGVPTPMDIEWARDGDSGALFVLQARPETVASRRPVGLLRRWWIDPGEAPLLATGRAIGSAVSSGVARVLEDPSQIHRFGAGDLLVSPRTDPDWEPILRRASGVITDQGGRTCHAAIIAREMGITAIVGTGDGTRRITDGQQVTASCAEGEQGRVYAGRLDCRVEEQEVGALPATHTRVQLILGNPEEAFQRARLPCDGVGLARLEFIIANQIGIHPLAVLQPQLVVDGAEQQAIATRLAGHASGSEYYVSRL